MKVKKNDSIKYPSMIENFINEIQSTKFTYFQLSCENEVHSFYSESDSVVEFKQDYLKETDEEGEIFYLAYSGISSILVSVAQPKEETPKADPFNDDDEWTGNRIQF